MSYTNSNDPSYKQYLKTNKLTDSFVNHLEYLKLKQIDSKELEEKQIKYCDTLVSNDDGSCRCFLDQISEIKNFTNEKNKFEAFKAKYNSIKTLNQNAEKEYQSKLNSLSNLNNKFLDIFEKIINCGARKRQKSPKCPITVTLLPNVPEKSAPLPSLLFPLPLKALFLSWLVRRARIF